MVSPLVAVLEAGVAGHTLVRSPDGSVYTGFADYATLEASECVFQALNSNRALNADVVRERVERNRVELEAKGAFMDFGQIFFLINNEDPSKTFYIMDGQHRCATMRELSKEFPDVKINFQFRVKICENEAQAGQELRHFQNSYPSDPRSFFPTQRQTAVATECLDILKRTYTSPDLFRKVVVSSRVGARTGDPDRPFMSDYTFFGMLQDSKLLEPATATTQAVLGRLILMEQMMAELSASEPARLGAGVSKGMIHKARGFGCFLGFFRPGKLEWGDLSPRLDAFERTLDAKDSPIKRERNAKRRASSEEVMEEQGQAGKSKRERGKRLRV
ncbi:Uncharacterized protein SCF082_LOCUS25079 [Durusdinium trenchii]|uniref:DGQHR domain-containing protein n=1 Tax=Durusdinium trenchii TaxID=1381693 RepID=A0ABP0LZT9_9DINO